MRRHLADTAAAAAAAAADNRTWSGTQPEDRRASCPDVAVSAALGPALGPRGSCFRHW